MIINFYRSINENIDPTYPRSRHANMKNNKLCKRDNIFNFGKGKQHRNRYIIWMIMYDYKLANIPRIIGVMRSRLTDNTLMESRRISTLRTAITSKTVVTCARYISSTRGMYRGWKLCPFIDSRFNFEKANPFLSRGIPVSKFKFDICTLAIYLRKGQTACFPAMFGREEIARTRAIKQVKC